MPDHWIPYNGHWLFLWEKPAHVANKGGADVNWHAALG